MRLIEADKVEQAIKDYWKAQVDKLPIPKSIEEHDERVNRLDAILEHNDGLLKAIDELPSAEPYTTTHDSIPAKTGKNDGDGTSGDCINRQAAIDAVKSRKTAEQSSAGIMRNAVVDFCVDIIKKLPSAQPEQRWIPVSERLPDKRGDYLVTLCGNGEPWVEIALWNETFGGRWQMVLYNDVDYSDISNVIAWMPLPEPYQERGEQDGMEK